MQKMKIRLLSDLATAPKRATDGSAGYDIYAAIESDVLIKAGETVKIPTGVAIEIPQKDYVALIFARSSLGIKKGITPANAVGVIDSDYRGEIIVALHNHSREDYVVSSAERIAQMLITPVALPELEVCDELSNTERGEGGFGSTGK